MEGVTVIPPGAGEILGDSNDRRVEALSERDELHATWSRFGPGRDGAGPHIHYEHSDLFYVLEGELTVKLEGDEEVPAPAGTLARIPPLVVHGFANRSDAEVKYLNLHAPGAGFIPYMRGMRDGNPVSFDVDEPDVEGVRPASEASIAGGDGVLCQEPAIAIAVGRAGEVEPDSLPDAADGVDSWFVLGGDAVGDLAGHELEAAAGTWVQVPAGTGPGFESGDARLILVRTPGVKSRY